MSDTPKRPRQQRKTGRLFQQYLTDAESIMSRPLWEWIDDWFTTGASSTMDVFTGTAEDSKETRIVLIGAIVDSSPAALLDELAAHVAGYCRSLRVTDLDAPFPPAKADAAPPSNTGRTANGAPTSAGG